tara:strand:- start:101 stop:538 length:438 start_codon:yes stop_codon:yes gene_type:complete
MSEKRYDGAVALIVSQTNYTENEAVEKLKLWKGNYMNVIKEYLNPNFNKKIKQEEKGLNQNMMSEIRNFMDNANSQFLKRKETNKKKQEYLKKVYDKFLDVKKKFPECKYDPPKNLSCDYECPNPMCPGQLNDDKKYTKKKFETK